MEGIRGGRKRKTLFRLLLAAFLFGAAACGQAASPNGHESFGVATHFGNGWHDPESLIPVIRDAGFGWIRDEVFWDQIEPEPGKYMLPDRLSRWVEMANAAGLKICLIFNVSPGAKSHTADKYDPLRYAKAAEFLAISLKGKIQALEILNEPNASGFAQFHGGNWNGKQEDGSDSVWIGKYVRLINEAAAKIKAVSPDLKVIGLGAVPPANYRMLRRGISSQVDGIVEHPYSFRTVPEVIPYPSSAEIVLRDGVAVADKSGDFVSLVRRLREECEKNGGDREIWLTEWGYTTYLQTREAMHQPSTEEAQAAYAARRFLECLALGVKLSVYYDIRDDGPDPHEPEHHFGLLRRDGTPKLAYHVLQRLFPAVRGWTPDALPADAVSQFRREDREPVEWDRTKLGSPNLLRCHRFRDGKGRPALAVWSPERFPSDLTPQPAKIMLSLEEPSKVTGVTAFEPFTGNTRDLPFAQNGREVRLSDVPIPAHPVLLRFEVDTKAVPPAESGGEIAFGASPRFNKGGEFPGAEGGVAVQSSDGEVRLDLTHDFRGGGKYVEAQVDQILLMEKPDRITLEVRGRPGRKLFLRLVDAGGELHQFPLPVRTDSEWSPAAVEIAQAHPSWGGDQNGRLDPPLKGLGLGVESDDGNPPGVETISFRRLRWE